MSIVRYATYPAGRLAAPYYSGRSPWSGLETEIDRLFATALTGLAAPAAGQFPVDVYEDKDNAYVRAELPGVKREDVSVETVNGVLTLSASRKQKSGEEEQSFSFTRSLTLPDNVQADKVSAAYEDGVLTVTLPKREEAKPRKVTVAVK